MTKLVTILGTRPDIIRNKLLIEQLDKELGKEHVFIYSGQNYDKTLYEDILTQIKFRTPNYNMKIASEKNNSFEQQIGKLFIETKKVIEKYKPEYILFWGDTNTTLASIEVARHNIPIIHGEAGMRSFDFRMPEEKNRYIADRMSAYQIVYTNLYKNHLTDEGFDEKNIFVSGNVIIDVLNHFRKDADKSDILDRLNVKRYIFLTAHRAENVDNPSWLKKLFFELEILSKNIGLPVVYPIHPHTKKKIAEFGIKIPECVMIIEPVTYFDAYKLELEAECIITDSGTVSEEAYTLHKPQIVVRKTTERPEVLENGAATITGEMPINLIEHYEKVMELKKQHHIWKNLLGDGKSIPRVANQIINFLND